MDLLSLDDVLCFDGITPMIILAITRWINWRLLGLYKSWNAPLFVMGGLFLVGAVCWAFIDPRQRIFEPSPSVS